MRDEGSKGHSNREIAKLIGVDAIKVREIPHHREKFPRKSIKAMTAMREIPHHLTMTLTTAMM